MKNELIDKLYEKFEQEKEIIKKNLEDLDVIVLQTNDDYGNVKLIITYEEVERKWQN